MVLHTVPEPDRSGYEYIYLKCNKVHSLYKMHPSCTYNRETTLIATGRIDQLQMDGTDCNWARASYNWTRTSCNSDRPGCN
jgi:hypothetical protein